MDSPEKRYGADLLNSHPEAKFLGDADDCVIGIGRLGSLLERKMDADKQEKYDQAKIEFVDGVAERSSDPRFSKIAAVLRVDILRQTEEEAGQEVMEAYKKAQEDRDSETKVASLILANIFEDQLKLNGYNHERQAGTIGIRSADQEDETGTLIAEFLRVEPKEGVDYKSVYPGQAQTTVAPTFLSNAYLVSGIMGSDTPEKPGVVLMTDRQPELPKQ